MYQAWKPYVSVAERRRQAAREAAKLRKAGHRLAPVAIEGRAIARTFWGKAWCDNLERYSDFANRLPRGRTYVRNGSVMDLQIDRGKVEALVSGSSIYRVTVTVKAVPAPHWKAICKDSAGAIDSLVELLAGRFSKGVMERMCRRGTGMFPSPAEIDLDCTCPDWAVMCKHVAAVLYGVGARLDERPELLFRLRDADERDLVAAAGAGLALANRGAGTDRVLEGGDLAALFGLDLEGAVPGDAPGKAAIKPGKAVIKPDRPAIKPGKAAIKPGKPAVRPAKPVVSVRRPLAERTGKAPPAPRAQVRAPGRTLLDALDGPQGGRWMYVETLVALGTRQGYRDAAAEVAALASQTGTAGVEARGVLAALRQIHSNKRAFLRELDERGLRQD